MSFLPRSRDGRNIRRNRSAEALDSMPFHDGAEAFALTDPSHAWSASSHDLLQGLEVSDVPLDTLPDDLISGFNKR